MCCVKTGWPPYTPEEFEKLPEELRDKLRQYARSQRARENVQGVCPFYDILNDNCTQYSVRPQKCRDFQLNGPECKRYIQIVYIGNKVWEELHGITN